MLRWAELVSAHRRAPLPCRLRILKKLSELASPFCLMFDVLLGVFVERVATSTLHALFTVLGLVPELAAILAQGQAQFSCQPAIGSPIAC